MIYKLEWSEWGNSTAIHSYVQNISKDYQLDLLRYAGHTD